MRDRGQPSTRKGPEQNGPEPARAQDVEVQAEAASFAELSTGSPFQDNALPQLPSRLILVARKDTLELSPPQSCERGELERIRTSLGETLVTAAPLVGEWRETAGVFAARAAEWEEYRSAAKGAAAWGAVGAAAAAGLLVPHSPSIFLLGAATGAVIGWIRAGYAFKEVPSLAEIKESLKPLPPIHDALVNACCRVEQQVDFGQVVPPDAAQQPATKLLMMGVVLAAALMPQLARRGPGYLQKHLECLDELCSNPQLVGNVDGPPERFETRVAWYFETCEHAIKAAGRLLQSPGKHEELAVTHALQVLGEQHADLTKGNVLVISPRPPSFS